VKSVVRIAVALSALCLGCNTLVTHSGFSALEPSRAPQRPALAPEAPIAIYAGYPEVAYEPIGLVGVTDAPTADAAIAELRRLARAHGANAIVGLDVHHVPYDRVGASGTAVRRR
jgi:hypothetical protein